MSEARAPRAASSLLSLLGSLSSVRSHARDCALQQLDTRNVSNARCVAAARLTWGQRRHPTCRASEPSASTCGDSPPLGAARSNQAGRRFVRARPIACIYSSGVAGMLYPTVARDPSSCQAVRAAETVRGYDLARKFMISPGDPAHAWRASWPARQQAWEWRPPEPAPARRAARRPPRGAAR